MRATIKKTAATGPKLDNDGFEATPAMLTITIEIPLTKERAGKLAELMRSGEQCEVEIEPAQIDMPV